MNFDVAFDLQRQTQGQRTGYRVMSRNYVSTCTKIVSSVRQRLWAADTTIIFDLAFDLQNQTGVQGTGHGLSSQIYVSTSTKLVSSDG